MLIHQEDKIVNLNSFRGRAMCVVRASDDSQQNSVDYGTMLPSASFSSNSGLRSKLKNKETQKDTASFSNGIQQTFH